MKNILGAATVAAGKFSMAKIFEEEHTRAIHKKQFEMPSIGTVIKYIFLIVAAIITLIPISTVVLSSFKTSEEFLSLSPFELPSNFLNFFNYEEVLLKGHMVRAFINTAIQLLFIAGGTILIGTMSAYVLHRFNFKFKKIVMALFLGLTLIPGIVTNVATFQIIDALGVYNTRLAGIVLGVGTDIIAIYIYLQFLDSISVSLDESATIDGASYLTIFFRIILPLLKPATITVLIIKCVNVYNDFYTAFLYMPNPDLAVISTVLFKFKGPYGTKWEVICAAIMLAVVPTLIIFVALQKHIYNGFVQGAVKQ